MEGKKKPTGWSKKVSKVTIDPSLNDLKNQNLFPEKLALANQRLKGMTLPEIPKKDKKN